MSNPLLHFVDPPADAAAEAHRRGQYLKDGLDMVIVEVDGGVVVPSAQDNNAPLWPLLEPEEGLLATPVEVVDDRAARIVLPLVVRTEASDLADSSMSPARIGSIGSR